MRPTSLLICLALAACNTERNVDYLEPDSNGSTKKGDGTVPDDPDGAVPSKWPTTHEVTQLFSAQGTPAVDLLFVVDGSGSMGEEQVALTNAFPKVIQSLKQGMGGSLPDLHIGVISADLGAGSFTSLPSCEVINGDGGKLLNSPRIAGCTPPSEAWISHAFGETNVAAGADDPAERVAEAFACIARIGTGGCGFEQQLEAARRALDPVSNINPGFLRSDAVLAVVFLTDEDDCSAQNPMLYDPSQSSLTDPLGPLTSFRCFEFGVVCDVNDRNKVGPRNNCVPGGQWLHDVKTRYVDFFKSLKPANRLVVAAIAGPTQPVAVGLDGSYPTLKASCMSAAGTAVPAIRLKAVVDALGGQFTSICEHDFGPALVSLGKKIGSPPAMTCLDDLLDTSSAPGLQPDCLIEELADPSSAGVEIPVCGAASGCSPCPCWRLVSEPLCSDGHALKIERSTAAPPGLISATCLAR